MVQTVFIALLKDDMKTLRRYRGRGRVAGYLAAVAACRVLDDLTLRPSPRLGAPGGEADGPAVEVERREGIALLREGMEVLAPRERLAVTLQAEGASLAELGRALGLSAPAAGQVVSRARARLREILSRRAP